MGVAAAQARRRSPSARPWAARRSSTPRTLTYTDGLSGEVVHCYHVPLTGLSPATTYTYTVADPGDTRRPSSHVHHHRHGPLPFAFTSFGDLGTPGAGATYTLADGSTISSTTYSESQWNAYNAVGRGRGARRRCSTCSTATSATPTRRRSHSSGRPRRGIAGVQPAPEVWRDFALNAQRRRPTGPGCRASATTRPSWTTAPTATPPTTPGSCCPATVRALPRQLLLVPGGLGAVHQPRRQRRLLPGRRRLQRRRRGHHRRATATRSRPPPTSTTSTTRAPSQPTPTAPSPPAGPRPTPRRPGWSRPCRGPGQHHHRLDHRPDAPVRPVLVDRQRLRRRDPPGLAPAVRPVPGGPGGQRARPRLRAVLSGARLHRQPRERRPSPAAP